VEHLRSHGADAAFRKPNVCDEAQWQATVNATLDLFGGLDVFVNNAGVEGLASLPTSRWPTFIASWR
jgi:NAD(P)-dependent dehydrogenase (short-subunit alcohol dehydrogenase family)